jgi:hypothetical protein
VASSQKLKPETLKLETTYHNQLAKIQAER